MNGHGKCSWMAAGALVFVVGSGWAVHASMRQAAPKTPHPTGECATAQRDLSTAKTQLANLTKQLQTAKDALAKCQAGAKGDAKACGAEQKTVNTTQKQVDAKSGDVEKLTKKVETACKK